MRNRMNTWMDAQAPRYISPAARPSGTDNFFDNKKREKKIAKQFSSLFFLSDNSVPVPE